MIYPPGRSQLKYQRVLGGCFVSVSHIQLFATPWTAVCRLPCPSLSPGACSNSCLSSQWCYLTISASVDPLLLLPLMFPSIRVFSNESALWIRWPKHWSFSFISPSNEYSGLISFRIDWFDLLAVQGILKSPLQHHSLKVSILWCPAFFYCPALTSICD